MIRFILITLKVVAMGNQSANKVYGCRIFSEQNIFDVTITLQVRIFILSKQVGYLLSLKELGEKSQTVIILNSFLNKPEANLPRLEVFGKCSPFVEF